MNIIHIGIKSYQAFLAMNYIKQNCLSTESDEWDRLDVTRPDRVYVQVFSTLMWRGPRRN